MLIVNSQIRIPMFEIHLSYARSSGPGGQNVNKVNSKAVLRWSPSLSRAFPAYLRERVLGELEALLNHQGELVISSDRFRDQSLNREDCLEKLTEIVARAAFVPKVRKETQPSYSSKKRVKDGKSRNSKKKNLRAKVRDMD